MVRAGAASPADRRRAGDDSQISGAGKLAFLLWLCFAKAHGPGLDVYGESVSGIDPVVPGICLYFKRASPPSALTSGARKSSTFWTKRGKGARAHAYAGMPRLRGQALWIADILASASTMSFDPVGLVDQRHHHYDAEAGARRDALILPPGSTSAGRVFNA